MKERRQTQRDRLNALDWMVENCKTDYWNSLDFPTRSAYLDLREDLSKEVRSMVTKLLLPNQMSSLATDQVLTYQQELFREIMDKLREEIARLTRKWKL